LAAEDFERVADLVEPLIPAMGQGRQEGVLRRWMEALPDELFRVRPVLSAGFVGARMSTGDVRGVEARLRDAERWLDPSPEGGRRTGGPSGDMVVVDAAAFRRLPAQIAMYRAGLALVGGDVAGAVTQARRALDLAEPDDHLGRGGPACLLGLAHWRTGDLEQAHRWYDDGMASLDRGGHRSDVVGGAVTLADIRIAQGRLRDAMSYYERGLRTATEQPSAVLRGAADMHVGMAELFRERNDLGSARRHLSLSHELGEQAGLPKNRYRWRVAMARLHQIDGDFAGALDLLAQAEDVYDTDFSPDVQPIPAIRARLSLTQGRIDGARAWVREQGLAVDDELSYLREFQHVTLARVLLAEYAAAPSRLALDGATKLLERLRQAAEDGGRTGTVIEVLALQALAHRAGGDLSAALASVHRALTLAEPEGYVRIFVDEGAPMAALLRSAAKPGVASGYARRLLAAVDTAPDDAPPHEGLLQPLSARELDVLRLLGTDLDGREIAGRLFVSLNTVRTHTKNIYAKLGVNSRRAAVRRAEELNLTSRSRNRRPQGSGVHDR
jgi:LuxR family maltose regulon positive regulatory protein